MDLPITMRSIEFKKGGNYGWPEVRGFCDGDVRGEKKFCQKNKVVEPLAVWTPTIAPSGLEFYNSELFSGWKGSLLFTTLKGAALIASCCLPMVTES